MTARKYATANDLTTPGEHRTVDVELSGGRWVQVRGLTRRELVDSGHGDVSAAEIELRNVVACLVQPKMTEAQVRTWQNNPDTIADLQKVSHAIRDLSGLGKGADKSDVDAVRD